MFRLRSRVTLALVLAAALSLTGVQGAQAATSQQNDVAGSVNQQRYAAGLSALQHDDRLDAIAQEWAQQMSNMGQMVHSTNEWRASRLPAGWRANGENIAYGYGSASAVMSAWMQSPGHKANILNSAYTSIGVGYVASGNYWVQLFAAYPGTTYTAPSAPKPAATKPAAPFGYVDAAGLGIDASGKPVINARGWSIDPSDSTRAVTVHFYVWGPDGSAQKAVVSSSLTRTDVASAFPGAGPGHGYSAAVSISKPGSYRYCSYALGAGANADINPSLGCGTVALGSRPIGWLDSFGITADGATPMLTMSGWAMDDALRAAANRVDVYVTDPSGVTRGFVAPTNTSRTDVGRAYPGAGDSHGFLFSTALATEGVYRFCAYSVNLSVTSNSLLGCRAVSLGISDPIGYVDSVSYSPASKSVAVKGWALDNGFRAARTDVTMQVTGPDGSTRTSTATATGSRMDLVAVFPGAGDAHGFTMKADLASAGPYTVCMFAKNAPALTGSQRSIGCSRIVVPSS